MNFGQIIKNITNFGSKVEKSSNVRALEPDFGFDMSPFGVDKRLFTVQQQVSVETLYNTVKASPECIACINAITEDIMSDGWRFEGSKSAVDKANNFEAASNFWQVLGDALIDMLITGNAYILKLGMNDEAKKKMTDKIMTKVPSLNRQEVDEAVESSIPKDLQLIKSGTVKIRFDDTGVILGYVQDVNGDLRDFSPDDIIHLRRGAIGGQPYGFTPLETALSDIATLIFAKEFAGKFFENDGTPNWLFKMPDSNPDDRNYKMLKKELTEFKKTSNRQRNLVLTGNIETEMLTKWNKDMEFSNLIRHFTQLVLIVFGVPPHRVNYVMDVKTSDSQSGKVDTGYYKNIGYTQKSMENSLNKYLWWPFFRVRMKFNRAYKIDEMREAQIIQLLSTTGAITIEEARERIGMDPEMKGTPINAVGDDKSMFRGDEDRSQDTEKPEDDTDNRLKGLIKSVANAVEISWFDFKRIVESKVGIDAFNRAKILFKENPKEYILFFDDGQWTYTTRVNKLEVGEEFKQSMIPFAIRMG